MKLGCHVSIAGSVDKAVDRAREIGCNTFQVFTRSPRMWKYREFREEEIHEFKRKRRDAGIGPVFSHMPYLPNLSSSNPEPYKKSIETLRLELTRCNQLGIAFLVTHLGSHLGKGLDTGIKQIVNAIDTAVSGLDEYPMLLLENTSGKTNEVGSTFEELGRIIDSVSTDHIGVCLDTCHAFARGYDISTHAGIDSTLRVIDETIGFDRIRLVHLNDSKGELGSRMDRHNHIGVGYIGEDGFRRFLGSKFVSRPLILETPVDDFRSDRGNMEKVRELAD
ncbi:deoxyribonuclease IV [Candidatus Bathyarchaeota archaeon]|nr:deoxyribonuclease IV [Candidatus Bathyarchaeota archaeon]